MEFDNQMFDPDDNEDVGEEGFLDDVDDGMNKYFDAQANIPEPVDPSETQKYIVGENLIRKYGNFTSELDRDLLKAHIKYDDNAYYYVEGGEKLQLTYKQNIESRGIRQGDYKPVDMLKGKFKHFEHAEK